MDSPFSELKLCGVVIDLILFSIETAIISLNSINQLIVVMGMCFVVVRTEYLNSV
jgi:hypothetical protein